MNIYHAVPGEPLPLGRRWEHNATRIAFDISAWVEAFGAGTVRLLHQRQGDAAPYPVTITRTDADGETANDETGTLVLWDVSRTDTAQRLQYGKAELRYYSGTEGAEEFLAKSETYKTVVLDALGASLTDAPDEAGDWLQTLLEAAETIGAASDAASAAQEAAQAAIADASDAANTARAAAIAARAAQDEAEAAAQAAQAVPSVDLPFSRDSALALSGNFQTVLSGTFRADADSVAGVLAEIPLTVESDAAGDAASGWTALSSATVTARLRLDGDALSGTVTQTLDSGQRVFRLLRYFTVGTGGTHTLELQLGITGGTAQAASGAVMGLSGAKSEGS